MPTDKCAKVPKKLTVKPTADHIIIKRDEVQDVSPGGIVLPEQGQEKATYGYVVAVGPGSHSVAGELLPMALEAGNRVCFGHYAGSEVSIGNETYVIMRESDVYFSV